MRWRSALWIVLILLVPLGIQAESALSDPLSLHALAGAIDPNGWGGTPDPNNATPSHSKAGPS